VLARAAVASIAGAPHDRPFFLWFAPSAPHRPWTPAARHAGTFGDLEVPDPPAFAEADVSDKPAWVRGLPVPTTAERIRYRTARIDTLEAMLGIDEAIRTIDRALAARGELDDTVIVLLTDNGYALGEHRWETKSCPYDVCTQVPLSLRVPGAPAAVVARRPVANTDVAATIADLAGAVPPPGGVGRSLLAGAAPIEPRGPVELEFLGDDPVVPRWRAIRSRDYLAVVYETGERELYDLTGKVGRPDPFQLENRADDPAYAAVQAAFADRLPNTGWDEGAEPGP
jgi:arylsulfatase A-like enzyme